MACRAQLLWWLPGLPTTLQPAQPSGKSRASAFSFVNHLCTFLPAQELTKAEEHFVIVHLMFECSQSARLLPAHKTLTIFHLTNEEPRSSGRFSDLPKTTQLVSAESALKPGLSPPAEDLSLSTVLPPRT